MQCTSNRQKSDDGGWRGATTGIHSIPSSKCRLTKRKGCLISIRVESIHILSLSHFPCHDVPCPSILGFSISAPYLFHAYMFQNGSFNSPEMCLSFYVPSCDFFFGSVIVTACQ
ncbi:hypothetical protein ABW19_dt0209399 [Dactylella cylindrospora]|nr:hypothetical protein ABW19_dt0209399 [Dactylella cylindrospora]